MKLDKCFVASRCHDFKSSQVGFHVKRQGPCLPLFLLFRYKFSLSLSLSLSLGLTYLTSFSTLHCSSTRWRFDAFLTKHNPSPISCLCDKKPPFTCHILALMVVLLTPFRLLSLHRFNGQLFIHVMSSFARERSVRLSAGFSRFSTAIAFVDCRWARMVYHDVPFDGTNKSHYMMIPNNLD